MQNIILLAVISIILWSDFSYSDSMPRGTCEEFDPHIANQLTPGKINYRNGREKLESLTFKFDVVGYGPEGRVVDTVDEVPVVGIPVEGGWLLGSDRGEWGGNLVFKPSKGTTKKLIDDNIEDIYVFPHGYIVTAGLTHMGMDQGSIYLVNKENYEVTKLYALTSAPKTSWLLKDGNLLINMWSGGSTIYKKNGHLSRIKCTNLVGENG